MPIPEDITVIDYPIDSESLPAYLAFRFLKKTPADTPPLPAGNLPALPHRTLGIDAARYQPRIDFAKAKAAGVRFAILKATEGATYTDPKFVTHWRGAVAAGVLVGAYHFFRPDQRNPMGEVANIRRVLGTDWGDLGLWLDVENVRVNGQLVDPATYAQTIEGDLRRLLDELEKIRPLGANLGLYTGAGFWDALLPGALDLLNHYPCWIANYPYNYSDSYRPRLPRGMKPEQLRIWQFDNGEMTWSQKIPGVTNDFGVLAKVDRNFFWKG